MKYKRYILLIILIAINLACATESRWVSPNNQFTPLEFLKTKLQCLKDAGQAGLGEKYVDECLQAAGYCKIKEHWGPFSGTRSHSQECAEDLSK